MKKRKFNENVTFSRRKQKKIGKFFLLFIFCCFFSSLIFISSALSNFLNINSFQALFNAVSVPAINIYCVASGQFENEKMAIIQSELIKDKGGAGYVHKTENKFTVLLFAYLEQDTALNVIEKNANVLNDLYCLKISFPKEKIVHNRTKNGVSALNNICNLKLNTFKQIQSISDQYDGGIITVSQTFNKIFNLSYQIEDVINKFEKQSLIVNSEDYNNLLMNAKNILSKINNLVVNTSKDKLACNIKHNALEVLFIGVS